MSDQLPASSCAGQSDDCLSASEGIASHNSEGGCRGSATFLLAYHEIASSASRYRYGVNRTQFQEHTEWLASLAAGQGAGARATEITFDDGHRSNFEVAMPLLKRTGLRAIFFVLAGRIGTTDGFMTWDQARELAAAGHPVQSHGWSHRLLTQCDARELEDELVRSKRTLEDRLGIAVDSISAPGGRWNQRVVAACARAGYTRLFHSNPWALPCYLQGVRVQGRLMVTGTMTADILRRQAQASEIRRKYLLTKYQAKECVRSLLGERLYHRLWSRLANFDPQDGMEVQVYGRSAEKEI